MCLMTDHVVCIGVVLLLNIRMLLLMNVDGRDVRRRFVVDWLTATVFTWNTPLSSEMLSGRMAGQQHEEREDRDLITYRVE